MIFSINTVCFSTIHWLKILVFILISAVFIFILKTATMSFFDPNPLSNQPYAKMVSDSYILRSIPSIFIPILSVLDYHGKIRIYTLMFFAVVLLIEILINMNHPPHYSSSTSFLFELFSCLKLGVYCSVILNYYIDGGKHTYTLIYSFIFTASINITLHLWKKYLKDNILSKNIISLKSKNDVLMMISVLLKLVGNFTNFKDNSAFIQVQGFLSLN